MDQANNRGASATPTATNTAGAVPEGWRLVPFEPTEEMITVGFESWPDAFFSKPEDWEAFQAMTGCQQEAHKARMCYGAMLAAAPSAPALAEQANFLLPDDMKALARFYECADDFDSGGHDVPKEAMRRLVEIGVVRPAGPGRHMATSFGDHVMGRDAQLGLALPLKTLDERNQELALRSNQEKGEDMNTIHTEPGQTLFHYEARVGEGGLIKADNKLIVTEIALLAENERLLVLNDRYFTTLSKANKDYIRQSLGKESIHIYANDSVYGSAVHYSLYTYTKVRASTVRKHIETAIRKKYGFLVNGLNLNCIAEPA